MCVMETVIPERRWKVAFIKKKKGNRISPIPLISQYFETYERLPNFLFISDTCFALLPVQTFSA